MGKVRAFASHVRWSDAEITILREGFSDAAWDYLMESLPGRSRRKIECKAKGLGLKRTKPLKMTREQFLAAKRDCMARRRAADPGAHRQYLRDRYAANRLSILAKTKRYYERRFFWAKAQRLKGVTARELATLWKLQRGRCALTGQRLDRSAEPDHRLPKARGGTDEIVNIQWTTRAVNRAKRDLTDDEFKALCIAVAGVAQ